VITETETATERKAYRKQRKETYTGKKAGEFISQSIIQRIIGFQKRISGERCMRSFD